MKWPQIAETVAFVIGLGLVAGGSWMVAPELGLLIPGLILILVSVAPSHKKGK